MHISRVSCNFCCPFLTHATRTPDSIQHFKGIHWCANGTPRHENHELPLPPRPAAQFQAKKVIQDWNALPEAGNLKL